MEFKVHVARCLGVLAVALLLSVALIACDDDTPPSQQYDTGQQQQDQGKTYYDVGGQQPDWMWPDTSTNPDQMWPGDTYASPFGCQQDSDCFGLKCCSTPWGVKLCAPTCSK